jgi:hypothetical protein
MRRWYVRETWREAWLMPSSSPRLGRPERLKSLNRAIPEVRAYSGPIEPVIALCS